MANQQEGMVSSSTQIDPEENYDTGDASLDDPRNQDGIGEKELLVVSFGTSYNDSRRLTIGAIENALAEAFPDYAVRRAFTSQIIIDHIQSRDGVAIDNVTQALERAVANGVKTLVVQPTHLMDGLEYEELTTTLAEYSDSFEQVAVGESVHYAGDAYALVQGDDGTWELVCTSASGASSTLFLIEGEPIALARMADTILIPENRGGGWDVVCYVINGQGSATYVVDESGSVAGGEGEAASAELQGTSIVVTDAAGAAHEVSLV